MGREAMLSGSRSLYRMMSIMRIRDKSEKFCGINIHLNAIKCAVFISRLQDYLTGLIWVSG